MNTARIACGYIKKFKVSSNYRLCINSEFLLAIEIIYFAIGRRCQNFNVCLIKRTCGILQPVKSRKLLIFAPVSKVVFGNLINSGDIRTSSEISSLTNLITVDFPIPNTLLIVRNEFPVESLHNPTPTRLSIGTACLLLHKANYKFKS